MASSDATREYAAFVSYRHAEVDTAVARDVQHGLEGFHVPRDARERSGLGRIAPVFRDKEELPVSAALGDDIAHALAHAGALVVVCSPRTKESMWVAREIDTFLETHDRSRVFTVLAEGEPFEVIPERLLYDETDGVRVELEPLSCDFRSEDRSQRRAELTRLAAAILGVSFDSLMRRAQRRRLRIAAAVAAAALVATTSVAAFALWSNARIKESYDESVARRAQLLVTEAEQALDEGDRLEAIELAAAAMPAPDEDRPVPPRLANVLCEATRAYDVNERLFYTSSTCLVAKYELQGEFDEFCTSPNEKYLAALNKSGLISVWDLHSSKMLFQSRIRLASYGHSADIVITDEGHLLAIGDDDRVTCWDILSQSHLWDQEMWLGSTHQLLLNSAGTHAIVLGSKDAYLIDAASGKMTCEVPYPLDEDSYPVAVGGDRYLNDGFGAQAFDTDGDLCVLAITREAEPGSTDRYDQLCLIDFANKKARMLPARYDSQSVHGTKLIEGNQLIVSRSAIDSGMSSSWNTKTNMAGQSAYSRLVSCISLANDKTVWESEIPLWAPDIHESFLVSQDVDGYFMPESGKHTALVYCVADVCEVLDLATGKSFAHYEAIDPYVVTWPHMEENTIDSLRGFLVQGRTVCTFFSKATCSSYANQCVDALWGLRLNDSTLLATQDGKVYRYADELEDEARVDLTTASSPTSLCTNQGVLLFDSASTESEDSTQRIMTVRKLDCSGEDIAWELTIEPVEDSIPRVLGYRNDIGELYVSKGARGDMLTIATIKLDTGEVSEWEAQCNLFAWDGAGPYAGEYLSYPDAIGVDLAVDTTQDTRQVVLTDLTARSSRAVPVPEPYSKSISYSAHAFASPDQRTVLIPTNVLEEDTYERISDYAILNPNTGSTRELATPLSDKVGIAWSYDGNLFAGANKDTLVVCDIDGNELLTAELDGRVVCSLHLENNKLLVVCDEQTSTVLLAYALDGSKPAQRVVLNQATGVASENASGGDIQWISASTDRDSKRDPGNLCIFDPGNRCLYLVDTDTLGLCQKVDSCLGYDADAGCFVVRSYNFNKPGDDAIPVGMYKRYTADELLERGLEQLGNSRMPETRRHEYGIDEG